MKVLLINASPNKHGATYRALHEVEKQLQLNQINTEMLWLGNKPIPGCIACWNCKKTAKCIYNDKVNDIIDDLENIDAFVFASPVYYASANGQLTSFMDRLFFTGGRRFNGKCAAAIVNCRRGGASAAFDQINKYFSISNMPIVTSQYWNQTHGYTPDEVEKDLEGLQTMRTLANNMAWLLKCIEAGKKQNINFPTSEQQVHTNFID